jgi:hypothetical protein
MPGLRCAMLFVGEFVGVGFIIIIEVVGVARVGLYVACR